MIVLVKKLIHYSNNSVVITPMISSLVAWLFNLVARLPLGVLHGLGTMMGRLIYRLSGKYAERMHS